MEFEFLQWLRTRLAEHPDVLVGVGDDAAVLRALPGPCVVTSDMMMDGVHFILEETQPQGVGRKSLAINLSDIAAMAARPVAAIVSLAVPRRGGKALAMQLYEGLLPLAAEFEVSIAGGDTNSWDAPLAISITVLGEADQRGPLLRSGGRPGDRVLVTGAFGGSLLGHQFDFQPRVREARQLHRDYEIHAAIDVSDGLSLDLSRLVRESGCGAVVQLDSIPIAEAAIEMASRQGDRRSPLQHALEDGEDFELILAVPEEQARRLLSEQPLSVPLTAIGRLVEQPGMWQATERGPLPLQVGGYQHGLQ